MPNRPMLLSILLAVALASCGGATTEPHTTEGPGTSGEEGEELGEMTDEPQVEHRGSAIETIGITPPERPWAEMSHDDREMYMVGKVLPVMNELFQRQFPDRYPEQGITCATCHGDDGAERGFTMPSGHLMPLPAQGSPASAALARSMPESLRFMRETVTPAMGTLLGIERYRCSGCHTSAP